MSLLYTELQLQVDQLNAELHEVNIIQKMYSDPYYVYFSVRKMGKTIIFSLGRGGNYHGLFLDEAFPPSANRVRDTYLEYLRKNLSNRNLIEVRLDQKDKLLALVYLSFGQKNAFYFFWKGNESYFAHYYYDLEAENYSFFSSWGGKSIFKDFDLERGFESFDEVGRKDLERIETNKIGEKKVFKAPSQKVNLKKDEKKILAIEGDLQKLRSYVDIQRIAKKLLGNEEDVPNKIGEVKFKFPKDLNRHQRIDFLFDKAKKFKEHEKLMEKRLALAKEKKKAVVDVDLSKHIVRPVWKKVGKTEENKIVKTSDEFSEFHLKEWTVRIGKSAAANDFLRSKWAKGDDWWVHLSQMPSAHAYLKSSKGNIDGEILEQVGSLLRDQSKLEATSFEIIYTQCKNLKGLKGKAGAVIFKKGKRLSIIYKTVM